ncbi:hypothetical protein GXM_02396 [Nostoc sphaeroides CCNUC1]|uniref:Uncharacterized protein n=1 Tax=Nostoc sphaeroides CCNUC1 TaxID=2653204 RepID=A0A5P8VX67_9NOSO|nr:hypothetical protein GXM_02396 [Nostoc sphaeroides CCNUC1]
MPSKIIFLALWNFRCGRWRGNFTITNFSLLLDACFSLPALYAN